MNTYKMPIELQRYIDFLAANPSPTDVVAGKYYMVPCANYTADGKNWLLTLEDTYANANAVCGVCPHRQIPLSAGKDMGNGIRQCPGHGLCWDRNGRMVRTAEEAPADGEVLQSVATHGAAAGGR